MAEISNPRKSALKIIQNQEQYDRAQILNAIFDLRHSATLGDEAFLYPLLQHPDDGIVASVLYSLVNVYEKRTELEGLLRQLAWGDERDCGEMPIQSIAISSLSQVAKQNYEILHQLQEIAESLSVSDVPGERAWKELATLFGVEWKKGYTAEMIQDPDSEESERIRDLVRAAMRGV